MTHYASRNFWKLFAELPESVQRLARKNFQLLRRDPRHPSLRLKKIGPWWSVRVGRSHRALGTPVEDGILWSWIGSHDDYDRLLSE